ncbi:unnamed protein product [Amoebophrya sp. A25]|nr:unnamed protein product [Amoebophrya sp. A25]|eukprot:GSA25T00008152001.1
MNQETAEKTLTFEQLVVIAIRAFVDSTACGATPCADDCLCVGSNPIFLSSRQAPVLSRESGRHLRTAYTLLSNSGGSPCTSCKEGVGTSTSTGSCSHRIAEEEEQDQNPEALCCKNADYEAAAAALVPHLEEGSGIDQKADKAVPLHRPAREVCSKALLKTRRVQPELVRDSRDWAFTVIETVLETLLEHEAYSQEVGTIVGKEIVTFSLRQLDSRKDSRRASDVASSDIGL